MAASGTGLAFGPGTATPAAIADAVRTALTDPDIRANARRVAAEIAALPSPDQAAAELEGLVAYTS